MANDVGYWNLIFIGAMLLLVVLGFVIIRNKKSKVDPEITERATRENYEDEQRAHKDDPSSGL